MKMKNTLLAIFAIAVSFSAVNAEYAVFNNQEDFEKSKWAVCEMATDGCNNYFVVDGKIGWGTRMACKPDFKPEWTCKKFKENTVTTLSMPITTSAKEGEFCGGIWAIQCNNWLSCKLDWSFPDAWGTCQNTPMPGSDKDNHGCIGSAGYIWSISKEKCIRTFEEDILTHNDKNFYEVIKKRLDSKYIKKSDEVIKKYEGMLKKYSPAKKQRINEKVIMQLEEKITEFLLKYPADAALPEKANNYYLMLSLIKFEMMQLTY